MEPPADPSRSQPPQPSIVTETRIGLIPLTCARCRGVIPAGQRYLRHTDRRAGRLVRFAECAECARRAGRAQGL